MLSIVQRRLVHHSRACRIGCPIENARWPLRAGSVLVAVVDARRVVSFAEVPMAHKLLGCHWLLYCVVVPSWTKLKGLVLLVLLLVVAFDCVSVLIVRLLRRHCKLALLLPHLSLMRVPYWVVGSLQILSLLIVVGLILTLLLVRQIIQLSVLISHGRNLSLILLLALRILLVLLPLGVLR